jgi:cell division protein FtsW (lipid II flippase)
MPEFLQHNLHAYITRVCFGVLIAVLVKVFCDMLSGRMLNSFTRFVAAFCFLLLCTAHRVNYAERWMNLKGAIWLGY